MMLPILISVSLAPGSYFFSAYAAVATGLRRTPRRQEGWRFAPASFPPDLNYFAGVSQVASPVASAGRRLSPQNRYLAYFGRETISIILASSSSGATALARA